jgi:hypothetical protein
MTDLTEGSRMRTNAGSPKTEKPNIIPKGQLNCNHRTPPKHHVDYLDDKMVIVNGVSYTRTEPTSIVIQKDENVIIVGGVKYQKVQQLPTIYEFLIQCEYGELNPPYVDKKIEIENNAENFLNYLYEYCDVIKEDNNELVVSISKKQMAMPND